MRRIYALIILLSCTATIIAAQETPKIELFGGYSFAHADIGGNSGQESPETVIVFVCPLDPTHCPPALFLGPTNLRQEVHTYSIGPQLSYRTDSRFTPFAHALFGGGYASNTTTFSGGHSTEANGSHVITLGGGFDVRLTSLLALRTQSDYVRTRFFHQPHDGFRLSTGIVFRFGKK